jgi:hypothetical protein
MPVKGSREFDPTYELGSEETGRDEQKDDVGFVQLSDDLGLPFLAGNDLTVAKLRDVPAVTQATEVIRQLFAQLLIFPRVGDE